MIFGVGFDGEVFHEHSCNIPLAGGSKGIAFVL